MRMIIIYTGCAPFDAPVISLLSRLEAHRSASISHQYTATHNHFRADLSASIYSHQNRSSQFNHLANIYLRTRQNELTGAHPATLNSIYSAALFQQPSITPGPAGESKRKRSRSSLRLRLWQPGITPEVRRPLHLQHLQPAPQLHRSWPCEACDGCHHRHRPPHRPWW